MAAQTDTKEVRSLQESVFVKLASAERLTRAPHRRVLASFHSRLKPPPVEYYSTILSIIEEVLASDTSGLRVEVPLLI